MEHTGTAVALGLFDGVHLGHRAVLQKACEQQENGLIPSVFTFSPESAVYKPDSSSGYIYGTEAKTRLICECGILHTRIESFAAVKDFSGGEFVREVLKNGMNAAFVCCGRDFRFGKGASCGVDELRDFGRCYGFEVTVVEDVVSTEGIVSSSAIRRLLSEGSIVRANELLGRAYSVYGTVVDGNHIGRKIDFPTVNQLFGEGQLVPAYGVYSGSVSIDGRSYRTVTNIGVKPTIEGERRPLAETHILGYSGDLYGRELEVRLEAFLRAERKFASLDELRTQIAEDVKIASADI